MPETTVVAHDFAADAIEIARGAEFVGRRVERAGTCAAIVDVASRRVSIETRRTRFAEIAVRVVRAIQTDACENVASIRVTVALAGNAAIARRPVDYFSFIARFAFVAQQTGVSFVARAVLDVG